jgi:hypothetical protein
MKTLYFMLVILVSFKSFALNEIEQSYQEALTLIKSESIAPPIASYLMSEASTVAFKTYKETRNKKAYVFSYLNLLKKYYLSRLEQEKGPNKKSI